MKALIEVFLETVVRKTLRIHIGLTCKEVLSKNFFFNEVKTVKCTDLLIGELFRRSFERSEPYF